MSEPRDHGGGLDAAIARHGGARTEWIDLSTGINPQPYPLPPLPGESGRALPDRGAFARLERAARGFWSVPDDAAILAAPGASALIARLPAVLPGRKADIPGPTYNEHAAAFRAVGWAFGETGADLRVLVHPNNPDGRLWEAADIAGTRCVIDESFCDVAPERSLVRLTGRDGVLVLKSFGKFWGLAGLRLGFAIGDHRTIARLAETLGPWAVSGPALEIATAALSDPGWADRTRARLADDADRLDRLMERAGARTLGGTTLFRLYEVENAARWQNRLARARIWSRIFPYSKTWLRLGLPTGAGWARLEAAL